MSWIEQYKIASFRLFSGQTLEGFQPIDFYHFFPLWYDLWMERSAHVMKLLDGHAKLAGALPTPSSMRAIIIKIIASYTAAPQKKDAYRIVTSFLARRLEEACPDDPFGKNSTPLHTKQQYGNFMRTLPWRDADLPAARQFGRLITAAGSLVHGLYNDLVTDFSWDTYGPYEVNGQTLLIRAFPNLRPNLWDEALLPSMKNIEMYGVYEGMEWDIAFIGCHTIPKSGNPVTSLKKFVVLADGKPASDIQETLEEISSKAEALYRLIRTKNFEELKEMVMLQECYQFKTLYDLAGVDWRPTEQMRARIRGTPLLQGVFPHGKLMETVEEYDEIFGISRFGREVLDL
jgi:hypothetical protein